MTIYPDDIFDDDDTVNLFSPTEERRRIQERKWITREMIEIAVIDMTDAHLINAYNMMLNGATGHFPTYRREAISMLGEEIEKRGLGEQTRLMRS